MWKVEAVCMELYLYSPIRPHGVVLSYSQGTVTLRYHYSYVNSEYCYVVRTCFTPQLKLSMYNCTYIFCMKYFHVLRTPNMATMRKYEVKSETLTVVRLEVEAGWTSEPLWLWW
jgi:hypothetical protein